MILFFYLKMFCKINSSFHTLLYRCSLLNHTHTHIKFQSSFHLFSKSFHLEPLISNHTWLVNLISWPPLPPHDLIACTVSKISCKSILSYSSNIWIHFCLMTNTLFVVVGSFIIIHMHWVRCCFSPLLCCLLEGKNNIVCLKEKIPFLF